MIIKSVWEFYALKEIWSWISYKNFHVWFCFTPVNLFICQWKVPPSKKLYSIIKLLVKHETVLIKLLSFVQVVRLYLLFGCYIGWLIYVCVCICLYMAACASYWYCYLTLYFVIFLRSIQAGSQDMFVIVSSCCTVCSLF